MSSSNVICAGFAGDVKRAFKSCEPSVQTNVLMFYRCFSMKDSMSRARISGRAAL